jgi:hypothetical protein
MKRYALPLVAVLLLAGCATAATEPDIEADAIAACEASITDMLKSPGSAEFDTSASEVSSSWTVTGTVDSQNGFGALLRSEFRCYVDGETTTVDYLK